MLIKRKKLVGLRSISSFDVAEISELAEPADLELQRARQEARLLKQEAQNVLAESQNKLKEAEAKAKEIIENANLEAEKIKKLVYEETLQAAKEEAEIIKSQARSLLSELFGVKRAALHQAHNDIIKVALDLASKIIRYQASVDPNVLKTQVVEAIKKATSEADRVQVFVNPQDLKVLEESIPEMEKLFPIGIDIVALAGDSVDPGSCVVETKSGQLDARFSAQLKSLTDLVAHLEIREPQIDTSEKVELAHKLPQEQALTSQEEPQLPLGLEGTLSIEKGEGELLSGEPLIHLSEEEEVFPFASSQSAKEISSSTQEEKQEIVQVDIPQEVLFEGKILEVPSEILEKKSTRKKLVVDDLLERTKEEAEELDDLDVEEERQEKKEESKLKNILKPKKSPSKISKIASELEKSPEWKDVVQNEDDEE